MFATLLRNQSTIDLDPIEEMRLRTWARLHYAPQNERDQRWHPIVLEEMQRRDREVSRIPR